LHITNELSFRDDSKENKIKENKNRKEVEERSWIEKEK
jgi:hypothetical protein